MLCCILYSIILYYKIYKYSVYETHGICYNNYYYSDIAISELLFATTSPLANIICNPFHAISLDYRDFTLFKM